MRRRGLSDIIGVMVTAHAAKRPAWLVALDNAKPDDEEPSETENAAVEEALASLRAGEPAIAHEQLMRATYGDNWRDVLANMAWPKE
jgi:hypothetical protein